MAEQDDDAVSIVSITSSVEDSILSNSRIQAQLSSYQHLTSVSNGFEATAFTSIYEYCMDVNKEPPPQSIFLHDVGHSDFTAYLYKVKGLIKNYDLYPKEDCLKSARSSRLDSLFS